MGRWPICLAAPLNPHCNTKSVGNRVVYSFIIKQGLNELPVRYSGIVPDTFKEGGEVVATGHLGPDGTFEATKILAKCASKYQAAS